MMMPSGPRQEAAPVDVLVLRDLADELGTAAAPAGNDVVDVVDGEHDAAYASVFAGALSGSALTAGVWNFVSSTRPWLCGAAASRCRHGRRRARRRGPPKGPSTVVSPSSSMPSS